MIKMVIFDVDGVLTNGKIYIDEKGHETKRFNYIDIDAYTIIKRKYKTAIITREGSNWIKNKFRPDYYYGWCLTKYDAFKDILIKENNLDVLDCCYIGDSLHDIDILKSVGLSVCPNNALDEVKQYCHTILSKNGGDGVIYELKTLLEIYNGNYN